MTVDPFAALERVRGFAGDATAARRILHLLDLTSLRGDETAQEIERLCMRAKRYHTAAVCIPPGHLEHAAALLAGSGVRLATVANFPDGGEDLRAAAAEVRHAAARGAQEVDVVVPLEAARAGDVELTGELLRLCREAAGPEVALKAILETGLLETPATITAVARAAVMGGADFLKTSTGRREPGATLEAAALLLAVIQEADGRVGLKLAGGLRQLADAAPYLRLVEEVMGAAWITPDHLRFGATRLLDDLLQHFDRGGGPEPAPAAS